VSFVIDIPPDTPNLYFDMIWYDIFNCSWVVIRWQ